MGGIVTHAMRRGLCWILAAFLAVSVSAQDVPTFGPFFEPYYTKSISGDLESMVKLMVMLNSHGSDRQACFIGQKLNDKYEELQKMIKTKNKQIIYTMCEMRGDRCNKFNWKKAELDELNRVMLELKDENDYEWCHYYSELSIEMEKKETIRYYKDKAQDILRDLIKKGDEKAMWFACGRYSAGYAEENAAMNYKMALKGNIEAIIVSSKNLLKYMVKHIKPYGLMTEIHDSSIITEEMMVERAQELLENAYEQNDYRAALALHQMQQRHSARFPEREPDFWLKEALRLVGEENYELMLWNPDYSDGAEEVVAPAEEEKPKAAPKAVKAIKPAAKASPVKKTSKAPAKRPSPKAARSAKP